MAGAVFLQSIDWRRLWLRPYREVGQLLARSDDWRLRLNALAVGIRNSKGLPIQFVPQASLPPKVAYETFINLTGRVPTRENLHDFFNALVWLTFPRLKIALNARQAAEIERAERTTTECGQRGPVRDAATLFDENAALLVVSDTELLDELRAHRWQEVFLSRREQFQRACEVFLFGHALMEKLVTPYKAITAHAVPVLSDSSFFSLPIHEKLNWLDEFLAAQVTENLSSAIFTPLPVLGVPNWWAGQDEAFYADTSVFRSKRKSTDDRHS